MVVIVGAFDIVARGSACFAFSFLQKKWFTLPSPQCTGFDIAVCCHGNATNRWTVSNTSLTEDRNRSVAVAMTDEIYIIGGVLFRLKNFLLSIRL